MSPLQKKIFKLLFVIFLSLLGLQLPHKSFLGPPAPIAQVLGESSTLALSTLLIEPQAGVSPIVEKINSAHRSIDLTMYLLSEKEILDSLMAAHDRGVTIQILLEETPFGTFNMNKMIREKLTAAGIEGKDQPPGITYLHQKTLLMDDQEFIISTFNYTHAGFTQNRGYALVDRSTPDVLEAKKLFEADWNRTFFTQTIPHFVISPSYSRDKLLSLLSSAKAELLIEDEVINDEEIIDFLIQKAKSVSVKVLLADPKKISQNEPVAQKLRAGGVDARFLLKPYLHAKLIVVDASYAYLGSVNLTKDSLDENIELGIIFSNPDLITPLQKQFGEDWGNSTQ